MPFKRLSDYLTLLVSSLTPNSSVTLHFTARGAFLGSSYGRRFLLAALSLDPRRDSRKHENGKPIPTLEDAANLPDTKYSYLPMYITSRDVLRILRSHSSHLDLQFRDVSAEYAAALDERVQKLTRRINSPAVKNMVGKEGDGLRFTLRDELFLQMWSAAVVKAGYLARWEVVLTRKDA